MHDDNDNRAGTRTGQVPVLPIVILLVGGLLLLAAWMLSPADEQPVAGDPSAATEARADEGEPNGTVVGHVPDAPAADTAKVRGVAPINDRSASADERSNYSSASVAVGGAPSTSAEVERAVKALERATDGIHGCVRTAQARHDELNRPGKVDPMMCVYEYTAFPHQEGPVRFDIVTRNGYSYYADAAGLRLRYSEYDGQACRSTDEVAGCDSW